MTARIRRRTVVVGGGMLGLGAARRLAVADEQVTVLEAAPYLGGLAAAWELDGFRWDRFYHVILGSDLAVRDLLRGLDLETSLTWRDAGSGFYARGRFHPMNGLADFLRFPLIGLVDKLRLGLTILHASRIRDPAPLDDVPLERWLRAWSGDRAFARVWQPLLRAKLGERYVDASATFIWATIARLYAARRAGLGRERFGYVAGGYGAIVARLAAQLRAAGVELRTDAAVVSVARVGDGFEVRTGTDVVRADRVLVTAPPRVALATCVDLREDERAALRGPAYLGIVCASLVLPAPLGPYYVTNLVDPLPFTGVIDMGTIVDAREFGGASLVYLPRYAAPDDPIFARDDESIRAEFCAALAGMYPGFDAREVRAFRVARVREVFALPTCGYARRAPRLRTSIPGLVVANSAQILDGTLNVDETLRLADRAVAELSSVGKDADAR